MGGHFTFSDESGKHVERSHARSLRSHPYYVRASVTVRAEDWRALRSGFMTARRSLHIPDELELRWSHIWSIWRLRRSGRPIPRDAEFAYFDRFPTDELVRFVKNRLLALRDLPYRRVVLSVTSNARYRGWNPVRLYTMHLQDLMQRIEMEMQDVDGITALYLDSVDPATNAALAEAYSQMFRTGDFITEYSRILDCIGIECSHHSVGIQLADYIAGATDGWLRGFNDSCAIFNEAVRPCLRESASGRVLGYGLLCVPADRAFRLELAQHLSSPHAST